MTALERLAWAALPEQAIVSRVASGLIKAGIRNKRGEKGSVKDAVRASYPPRGFSEKRFDAVLVELKRQIAIRDKRVRDAPYVWHRTTSQDRRIAVAMSRIGSSVSMCFDVRSLPGHSVYLITSYRRYMNRRFVVVLHRCSGVEHEIQVSDDAKSIGEAIFKLHRAQIDRVIQCGGFYTVDFCRLCTTLHPLDGPSEELFWPIEDEQHPLYRPNGARCENRA